MASYSVGCDFKHVIEFGSCKTLPVYKAGYWLKQFTCMFSLLITQFQQNVCFQN